MRSHLTADQARLYEMIWKRTLACQMTPARFDTVSVDIRLGGDTTLFRANGQVLVFPGFIGVYMEDVDDATEEDGGKLPPLAKGVFIIVNMFCLKLSCALWPIPRPVTADVKTPATSWRKGPPWSAAC